jgi:ABC-type glycerol-3-phosphate transport system substrate-binding protein
MATNTISILILFLSVLLFGCGAPSNTTVTLITNRPEIASYAEVFNSVQDSHRLELQFSENPGKALNRAVPPADIIISEYITGRSSLAQFRPLNKLFENKRLNKESFYRGLLLLGQRGNQQILLPLSFNLPIVMFDSRVPGEESASFFLNLEQIKDLGRHFNRQEKGKTVAMGFSPRWDPGFLILAAALWGTDFTEGSDAGLSWNDRKLREAVAYLRKWSDEANGGPMEETVYAEKYLYDPPYRQVSLGRAKFAYTTAADFFLLPENRRISLDFRWIAHGDKILALECALFAGIPTGARNPRGAEAFLQWLLSPDTQKTLLESSRRKMTHTFGIASGFSSLMEVNERVFPRFYPHLTGHIPPGEILIFPPPLMTNWREIKFQVLRPYFLQQTASNAPIEELRPYLRAWLQKQTY